MQQQQKATTYAMAHPHATNPIRLLSLATGLAPFVFLGEMIFAGGCSDGSGW
jgi:hypothetical protein